MDTRNALQLTVVPFSSVISREVKSSHSNMVHRERATNSEHCSVPSTKSRYPLVYVIITLKSRPMM
ncbi:hypothetical protein MAR_021115 [Mya arenaria]|uniref:Uncharacterized protein n=1 Tax=Mya arenaria TaxID=6604 RepID=A0ABY7EAS1_MYAAR|nr:hypothetical protein MAR_021115 [Mya arenaria]